MDRTVRPTILVAYGEEGLRWLRQMRADLIAAGHEQWFDHGVWQCWVVGARSDDSALCYVEPGDGSHIRERLDSARPADLAFEHPNFVPREVLVVERASIMSQAGAQHNELRATIESVRASAADEGRRGLDLLWLAFADSVRAAGAAEAEERVRRFFSTSLRRRTFLVDRVTQTNAVVQPDVADWVLLRLALSALTSDLLLPPALEGNVSRVREFDEDGDEADVTPVGIVEFRHDDRTLQDLCVTRLEQQFRNGVDVAVLDALRDDLGPIRSLAELLEEDLGRSGAGSTRDEREVVLNAFFATHLARSTWDVAEQEVEMALRRVRAALAQADAGPVPGAALAMGPTQITLGLGATVLLAALLLWWYLRSRRTLTLDAAREGESRGDQPAILREWFGLLQRAARLVAHIRERMELERPTQTEPLWRKAATSFEWSYVPHAETHNEPASRSAVRSMSDQLVRWTLRSKLGDDPSVGYRAALGATASAIRRQDSANDVVARAGVLRSLAGEFAERLPNLRPMAQTQVADLDAEVIWLTEDPVGDGDALRSAERGAQARSCRVLGSLRSGVTTRIVIGATVRWSSVGSFAGMHSS